MKLTIFLFIILASIISGCAPKSTRHMETQNLPTHNLAIFAQGRYCNDYLKFECLPESKDPAILHGNEPLVDGKFPFYEYDTKKYNNLVRINEMDDKERREKMEHYVLTKADYKWMDQVRIQQWYEEMEVTMEKQYPGFWGDTPRPVRHRWMRLCVAKAMKYGYGLKKKRTEISENPYRYIDEIILDENGKPYCVSSTIRENQQFIQLCGRIGLNFDREEKWQYIVDFIKRPDSVSMGYAGAAVDYIDFTIYKKDYDFVGNKFTDWSLRDSIGRLPRPDRPIPRLNDPE